MIFFNKKGSILNAAALGMKHKLHGTTPIERTKRSPRALTQQTDLSVSSGMSSPLSLHKTLSALALLSEVRC